jgi:hypothetical protein
MSFLYEIFDEAMSQAALDKILKKTAQVAQTPLSPNDVAKKLVNRLSREMSAAPEPLNIASETATPIDLNINDLQSLGKLLQFMSNNKIKLDGSRIVYSEADVNSLPEEERNQLAPITVNLSRDAASRKWNTADYYSKLPLLIKYVSYLQEKAQSLKKSGDAQGKILEVMVGKLIDSINNVKPDSGLSRVPKSQPDKPNELPDNTVIDTFGSKVFNIADPYADKGDMPLSSKDLSSKESLNAWLKQAPEATILYGQTLNKFTDPAANHCNIINVLYKRAYNLKNTASPADSKKYNFYLNKIIQLGQLFTDPSGSACTIGGTGSSGVHNRHNFYGPSGQGDDGSGGKTGVSSQILEQIIQTLPFDTQDIDFIRIKNFFSLYTKVTSSNYVQSAITSMGEALKAMATASESTLTGNQEKFRITRNVQEMATWLKQPAGNHALPFLYALQQVLTETEKVLGMFYSEYARTLYSGDAVRLTNEQKALVEAQYLGGNSIFSQNLRDVQSLMANTQQVLGKK